MRQVDLASVQVVAEALSEEAITQLAVAPGRRDVFVLGVERPVTCWDRSSHRLRWLDAATLAIRAERAFDRPRRLLI